MASFVYNEGADSLLDGTISYTADTIKIRLVASSVTPNKDDTVMTGYTAIGTDQTLGTKTRTKDATNDRIVYSHAVVTWTAVAAGSTVGYVVIYKFVTNDADSIPIACIDVTDIPTNGSNITWTADATNGSFYTQQ